MGDFTDILNAVPEFTKAARREVFVSEHGMDIVRITPMDGSEVIYLSSILVNTTQGPMAVKFEIKADTINAAIAAWQTSARAALRQFAEQLRANQRRIVLPGNPAANSLPFKPLVN